MNRNSETRTVYITKYALTKGIYKAVGMYFPDGEYFKHRESRWSFISRKSYEFTLEEAQTKAVELAKIKKSSIEKQLAKIDAIINGKPVKIRELD
jgi:hypothetical protein